MSQLNPNVFFEFGIRTALNKPVALVTDEVTPNIPFDTGIINYHRYNSSLQGWLIKSEVGKLSEHINKTLESEPDRNSLWKYFGIAQTGFFNTDQATSDDKLSLLLRKIDSIAESIPASSSTLDLYSPDNLPSYQEARDAFEKDYLNKLLSLGGGSINEMAKRSGMSRARLYDILKRLRPKSEEDG